ADRLIAVIPALRRRVRLLCVSAVDAVEDAGGIAPAHHDEELHSVPTAAAAEVAEVDRQLARGAGQCQCRNAADTRYATMQAPLDPRRVHVRAGCRRDRRSAL